MGLFDGIDWGSVFGDVLSGVGAYQSANAASDSRNALTNAAQRMTTDLLPYNFYGPGGAFAGFGAGPQNYLPSAFGQPQAPTNLGGAGADIIGRAFNPYAQSSPAMDPASMPQSNPYAGYNPNGFQDNGYGNATGSGYDAATQAAVAARPTIQRDTSAGALSFQPQNPNDPYYQRSDIAPFMQATNRDVMGGGKFGVRGWMNEHPVGMIGAMTGLAAGGAGLASLFGGGGAGAGTAGLVAGGGAPAGGSIAAGLGGAGAAGGAGWLSTLGSLASGPLSGLLGSLVGGKPSGGGAGQQPGAGGSAALGDPRSINISLGDMEPARAGLVGMGNDALGRAQQMGGLPANIQQALRGVQGASGLPGMPNNSMVSNGVNNQFLQSMFAMNRGSVAPGLQNQAFAGASNQIADASRGFGDVRQQTLDTLRAQAQPFETRAYDKLQNDQFARGQMGSSGGALQTEAFARGLGQADTDRQLQANNEARLTQQNALGLGQGMAGIGGNVAGLDDQLLQSAFGRFAQTAGLSNDLSQQRFGNSMLLNNTGYDRSQNNLQNQITAAGLPTALQGSQLALALQAMGGANSLNDQGLKNFQASLAASQASANARIGSGSNASALLAQASGMPTSGDMWGQFLTGAGSRMSNNAGNAGLAGILSGLFNKTPQPVNGQPPVGYQT